jgi:hypothetical protein
VAELTDQRRWLRVGDRVAEVSEDELEMLLNGLGVLQDDYCTNAAEELPFKTLATRLKFELQLTQTPAPAGGVCPPPVRRG